MLMDQSYKYTKNALTHTRTQTCFTDPFLIVFNLSDRTRTSISDFIPLKQQLSPREKEKREHESEGENRWPQTRGTSA